MPSACRTIYINLTFSLPNRCTNVSYCHDGYTFQGEERERPPAAADSPPPWETVVVVVERVFIGNLLPVVVRNDLDDIERDDSTGDTIRAHNDAQGNIVLTERSCRGMRD